jgi:hypothetical protein
MRADFYQKHFKELTKLKHLIFKSQELFKNNGVTHVISRRSLDALNRTDTILMPENK